ncbi:MAG: hypothetical protein Q8R76_09145 [Candidatus Omnitrophota bacterium]|nr:hypothetical protein [Candidatus Omnitrophota bacterium]
MRPAVLLIAVLFALPFLVVSPSASADDLDLSQFGRKLEPGETPNTEDPNVMVIRDPHSQGGSRTTGSGTTGTGTPDGPTPPSGPVTVDIPVAPGSSTTTPYTFYPGGLPPATSDNPSLNTSGEIWRAFARNQISRDDYIRRMRELQDKERTGRTPRTPIDAQDIQEQQVENRTKSREKSESNE